MSGEQQSQQEKEYESPLTPSQNLKFGALFTGIALFLAMALSGGSLPL